MPTDEDRKPRSISETLRSLAPVEVIRTETVLSRLPVHNLSKTGTVEIEISRRTAKGEVQFQWVVAYSGKYGPPRQLAYKLDTVVINRRLDQLNRPLPAIVRLGSLREIAQELGLGGDTAAVRKALRQNAFAGITAKVTYHTADGTQRWLEADFTRYSVIFAGEILPTGQKVDSVHLVLHEPYLEVLNNARLRPLNYDYLRELAPAAQRFYELISYRIYAALRYNRPTARLSYSDLTTFAPFQRYFDYDHFKKQMYKIHRPHLTSGYLAKVVYQDTLDHQSRPDWILIYSPGPKAQAEFQAFHQPRCNREPFSPRVAALPPDSRPLVAELTRRGITQPEACRLVTQVPDRERFLARLQFADRVIAQRQTRIANPPGFYIYALQHDLGGADGATPSDATTQQSAVPQEPPLDLHLQPEEPATRPSLAELPASERERLLASKKSELRKQYRSARLWTEDQLNETAWAAVEVDLVRKP